MYILFNIGTNQLKQVLPVILGHESEESQEGPTKRVIAGVAIVGVPPSLHAHESFWALSINMAVENNQCGLRPCFHSPLVLHKNIV